MMDSNAQAKSSASPIGNHELLRCKARKINECDCGILAFSVPLASIKKCTIYILRTTRVEDSFIKFPFQFIFLLKSIVL